MKTELAAEIVRRTLGRNLKALRVAKGYNQEAFAEILGIKQGALSQIETGTKGFTSESIAEICRRIGIEPWELLRPTFQESISDSQNQDSTHDVHPKQSGSGDRNQTDPGHIKPEPASENIEAQESRRGRTKHKTKQNIPTHMDVSDETRPLLSASAIPGPLTPADCAAVLLQLAEVSPERRAFVLGVLFDDASIVPDSLAGDLPRLLSTFR